MILSGSDGVIAHFIMDCVARDRSNHTLTSYKHHLRVLAELLSTLSGVTELEKVTVLHLRKCVQHLLGTSDIEAARALSVSSVRGYIRVWKVFFSWCYQEELIEKNPASRLAAPRPTKKIVPTFTMDHIQLMLSTFDLTTDMGYRDYVILLLLLDTGIRLGEISLLKLSDVHDNYIKVYGKGRKEREVGLHPEVSKLIWKYIHKFRHPAKLNEPMLFIDCSKRSHGSALNREGVKSILKRLKIETGIVDIRLSAHTFRHTFAKMYLQQGGELFKLSREMGHSDIQITKTYLEDFSSTDARKDHASFSPIAGLVKGGKLRSQRRK
ncbi:tyrosine recombinase XerD [Dictyobacter vulcani]|uniref:Tyrosine recombinase XerD n=1 Tax=Dictyobacter vulcani TaxID=2607529 RepID=A0A5J4KN32_9CHLR|nr:tyrosine-type recombinase/integrase [Dictyobacter vulcani]GER87820.1 tyrosine recombinase XerD [Dictyobacter vulcani]